jgi:hypothetical protein
MDQTFVVVTIVGFLLLVMAGAACFIGFAQLRPGRRSAKFGANVAESLRAGPALLARLVRPAQAVDRRRQRSRPNPVTR